MLAIVTLEKQEDVQIRYRQALEYVDAAMRLDPSSADAHWVKSQIEGLQHNVPEAINELRLYARETDAGNIDRLINYDPDALAVRIKNVKENLKNVQGNNEAATKGG